MYITDRSHVVGGMVAPVQLMREGRLIALDLPLVDAR